MDFTFGSLFAGIGGFDLGLERAGMKCKWQVEIDPFCRRVLEKHWPGVPKHGDIREITGSELEPVDLICGGFPCQPVSTQGHKKASDDSRWLGNEFVRVVGLLRPRFALMENVAGLAFWALGTVLGELAEIGYDAEWTSICPTALGGTQARERVFILAYPDSGSSRRIHPKPRVFPTPEEFNWSNVCSGEGGFHGGTHTEGVLWAPESNLVRVADGFPDRMDRIRALGNAVVPQVAEWIGRRIMEALK